MFMTGMIQHGGLAEDVIDHRLNSRTVYMNPISRWIYWNMNYHVEHHMFPMVPYTRCRACTSSSSTTCPRPIPRSRRPLPRWCPAILRQRREPGYYIRRELPPTARPYREEFHQIVPERASMRG